MESRRVVVILLMFILLCRCKFSTCTDTTKISSSHPEEPGSTSEGLDIVSKDTGKETDGNKIIQSDIKPYESQIGGHDAGIMKDFEGNLIKTQINSRELEFYENLEKTEDPLLTELKHFVPRYFGKMNIQMNDKDVPGIRIEDATKGFELPCIMDVKIGAQIWEPGEKEEKIAILSLRYVEMRKHWAFVIPGFQYHNIIDGSFIKSGREFNRQMLPKDAAQVIYNFVNGDVGIKYGLVDSIVNQLRKISLWFQRQKLFHFYGSSILLAYDAKNLISFSQKGETSSDDKDGEKVRVRMIDFAHALPSLEDELDMNYLTGLEKLIYMFDNLAKLYSEQSLQP